MRRANIGKLIDIYGGTAAVAKEVGVTNSAVSQWRKANSVPLKRAHVFADAFGIDRDLVFDPWGDSDILTVEETAGLIR